MASELGQAYVRIRPNLSGFKQETEHGVKNAFGGLGTIAKGVGGLFALHEIKKGLESVTEAAASQEEELAVVRNSLRQTGAAWTFHGKTVENTLRDLAVKFGFTVSDLAQGFTRIEVGTKNTAKSFDLLSLSMDVSRARHLDLATAATALTRASQGNDLAVRRLGIVIPRTTKNVDALRHSHEQAVASGVKFDKQQQFAYKTALAQAAALDVQANKVQIVSEIQKRFGGQSTAFANTAKGAFQSFHEAFNEFEVSLGQALIPTLTEASLGLARFFKSAADGQTIAHATSAAAEALGNAFHTIEDVAKKLAPTLELVAKPLTKIAEFAGFGGILGLIVAFKGVTLTLGLAEAAQRKYRQALALGRGEQAGLAASTGREAGAYNALTVAVERNTVAFNQNAIAAERAALAQRVGGGAAALQGVGGAAAGIGAVTAGANATAAATEKVTEGFAASHEAVVGFTADTAVLADVTRHTGKDLGEYERSVLGLKKGLEETSTAQDRYGRSLGGSNAEQAASAASAQKSSTVYRDLSKSVDGSAASLNANAAAAGRSAAALETGTVATITRVGSSYQTLATSGAQGAAGLDRIADSAHGASAGLLSETNQFASVAHHTQGLHQSFVHAGAGAKTLATEVTAVGAAEAKQALGAEAVAKGGGAATVATVRQTEATKALGVATVRTNELQTISTRSAERLSAAQLHFAAAAATRIEQQRLGQARQSLTLAEVQAGALANDARFAGTWTQAMEGHSRGIAAIQPATRGATIAFAGLGQGAKLAAFEVRAAAAAHKILATEVGASTAPLAAATAATGRQATAYDGLAVSTERAAAAQLSLTTASEGAAVATTGATIARTGATIDRLAASQLALGNSTRGVGAAQTTATGATKALGTEIEKTAVRSAGLGATFRSLGRGLFEMAGGVRTLALGGFALLAFTVYKLATQETDLQKTTKKLQETLGALAADFGTVASSAKKYADAISSLKTDKIARDEAAVGVARARQALATLDAKKGTAEYAEALLALRRANDEYRLSIGRVNQDEGAAASGRKARAAGIISLEHDKREALDLTLKALDEAQKPEHHGGFIHIGDFALLRRFSDTVAEAPSAAKANRLFADSLHKIIEGLKEAHPFFAQQIQDIDLLVRAGAIPNKKRTIDILVKTGSARAAIQGLIVDIGKLPGGFGVVNVKLTEFAKILRDTDPALARKIGLVREFQDVIGKTASPKEVNLLLNTKDFKGSIAAAVEEFSKMKGTGGKAGAEAAHQFAIQFAIRLKQAGLVKTLKEGLGLVLSQSGNVLAGISKATLTAATAERDAAKGTLKTQRTTISTAIQSANDAARQVASAQRSLADAIRSGAQSISDAVQSANQNLFSIGSSLSDSVDQFLDAQKKTDALIGPSAKQFKDLQKQLSEGASGTDLARSARALTNQIDEQQVVEGDAADKRKERSRRQIADLVAQFNKGAITLATFNKRVAAVLAADGITYKKAGRVLGIAFADGFRAQVKGLAQQAAAIQAGPHTKGLTGLEPSIVKPLEAVRDAQRQIKDAQQNLADSVRAQAKADRELTAAQKKLPGIIAAAAKAEGKLEDLQRRQAEFLSQQADDVAKAQKLYHDQIRSATKSGDIFGFAGGKSLGGSLGDGTKKGIQQAEIGVVAAIEHLISSLLGAGRKKAKAKSPSEETRLLGADLGIGLAHGISGSRPLVEKAAEGLASSAIRGMKQADDFLLQHAKHTLKLRVDDDFKQAVPKPLGDRGIPAAIEGRPHDRVMLAEALHQKRILTSQERHLGNLVTEARKQTAAITHRKPIPKPSRGGSAIRGARLTAHAE